MDTPRVPAIPLPVEEWELRGHLFFRHNTYSRNMDVAEMIECHTWDHDPEKFAPLPDPGLERPHTHTNPTPAEEWSWE